MPAVFSRIKDWTTEVLTPTDLNDEFDNILNNLDPTGVGDYSATVLQMQIQTSPGVIGAESLATSLGGEIERLRYVIARLIGPDVTHWYQNPPSTISDLVNSIGSGLPANRLVSGRTTGSSSQLCAIVPNGVSASVTIKGSVTPLSYYIAGTQYSITVDTTITGLSLAPSANNACSLGLSASWTTAAFTYPASGQQWTQILGMYGTQIPFTAAGTGILNALGTVAGFQAGTEYFMAYVESTAALTNAWRGAFFDQSANSVTASPLTAAGTISLMRLTWIFANTTAGITVTYDNPYVQNATPSSANTGDYWLNLATTAWMTFTSTTWINANATLIGVCMQSSAACVAARTFDSYVPIDPLNTVQLKQISNTQVQAADKFAQVSVFGKTTSFLETRPVWDITQNLEAGVTEAPNTLYYCYLTEAGLPTLSPKAPLNRRDLQGLYHPAQTWRCLGYVNNNNATNFETPARSFSDKPAENMLVGNWQAYNNYDVVTGGSNSTGTVTFPTNAGRFMIGMQDPAGGFSPNWFTATGAWTPIASISLTPGLWRVLASLTVLALGAGTFVSTLSTTNAMTIAIDANATPALIMPGYNSAEQIVDYTYVPTTVSIITPLLIPAFFTQVTTATTYKLTANLKGSTTAAIAGYNWYVLAERVDDLVGGPA